MFISEVLKKKSARRSKTSALLQLEAAECGAVALGIVLAYHGRHEPLSVLRKLCGVSRDGSRASQIVAGAQALGLKASAYRLEPADLKKLPTPFIVHWNCNHFVVVEGLGRRKVYINDPAQGKVRLSLEEFDNSFTGIAITLQRTPAFQQNGTPRSTLRSLLRRVWPHKLFILYALAATLLAALPGAFAAALPTVFVDHVVLGGRTNWGCPLTLALGATAGFLGLCSWLRQRQMLQMEQRLAVNGATQFVCRVLQLPLQFFQQRTPGDVVFRVSSNEQLAQLLTGEFANNIASLLLAAVYFLLLWRYDVLLTCLGACTAAANVLVLRSIARRRLDANSRLTNARSRFMGTSVAGLLAIENLKAMGAENDFFSRWSSQQAQVANAEIEMAVSSQMLTLVPPLLSALNMAAVLVIGGHRITNGLLTVGMLLAIKNLTQSFLEPVDRLVQSAGSIQEIEGALHRLHDVLDTPLEPTSIENPAYTGAKLKGQIELRGITFGYSRLEAPLISNLDLSLPSGSRVALAGGTGSGKSTIAKLIAGLHQPWAGEVLFDGVPTMKLDRQTIKNSLAIVDQRVVLFEGTIADNIRLWDETLSDEDVIRAAKDAMIHDDIRKLPGGYGYFVQENGRNLSGGQRQRIEIARALATNPRILILDEATSALDSVTEAALTANLRQRGCTCIIVAHRLSTIRDCDEILLLDAGRVIERGAHWQLLSGSVYSSLLSREA